jgi:hypothetical protein
LIDLLLNKGVSRIIDITGQKFGKLTALRYEGKTASYDPLWLCKCDCGNEVTVRFSSLKSGGTRSCGCLKKQVKGPCEKVRNKLIGQRFGRLTVIEITGFTSTDHYLMAKCECDCGNTIIIKAKLLRSGKTTSCGCYAKEKYGQNVEVARKTTAPFYIENTFIKNLSSKLTKSNTSGIRGVSWHKKSEKWWAYITFKKEMISLGYFDELDDAAEARKKAEEKYFEPLKQMFKKESATND